MRACSCPVSCVGNKPLGMTTYNNAVSTSVSTANRDDSCFAFLGAHGNSGNFAFWDGHAVAYNSPGALIDELKKEYTTNGQTVTASVWDQNKVFTKR